MEDDVTDAELSQACRGWKQLQSLLYLLSSVQPGGLRPGLAETLQACLMLPC